MSATVSDRVARTQAMELADMMLHQLPDKFEGRLALGAIGIVASVIIQQQAKDLPTAQVLMDRHIATLTALLARAFFR